MQRRNFLTITGFAATALVLPTDLLAGADDGLYAPAIDPNAGYIRTLTSSGLSAYHKVTGGAANVTVSGQTQTINVQPGSFMTVASTAGGGTLVADDYLTFSPAKADLAVYNLSDLGAVDFFVPAARANAVAGLGSGKGFVQSLNAPLTLDFNIVSNGAVVASVNAVELRRGEGVTIFVTGSGGNYTASAAPNTYKLQ